MGYTSEEYREMTRLAFWHTFESFDKNECIYFLNKMKPDMFRTKTRIDPETFRTIYIVEWDNCGGERNESN